MFFSQPVTSSATIASSKKEKETWKTSEIKKKLISPTNFLHGKKCKSVFRYTKVLHILKLPPHTSLQCQDDAELMDNQQSNKWAAERKYLLEVIRCLLYLGRQGMALQGQDGKENFTQLLRLLSTNDKNTLYHLEGKIGYKYTHNDVQNEILGIMAFLTLQEKLKTIR